MGARHRELGDRPLRSWRHPTDDTAPLGKPLRGHGHWCMALSRKFGAWSKPQLLRYNNGKATDAFMKQRPHRYEGGTSYKGTRWGAKQSEHVEMRKEGKITQTELDNAKARISHAKSKVPTTCIGVTSLSQNGKNNYKARKVKVAGERQRFSHPSPWARPSRRRHGVWGRNLKY